MPTLCAEFYGACWLYISLVFFFWLFSQDKKYWFFTYVTLCSHWNNSELFHSYGPKFDMNHLWDVSDFCNILWIFFSKVYTSWWCIFNLDLKLWLEFTGFFIHILSRWLLIFQLIFPFMEINNKSTILSWCTQTWFLFDFLYYKSKYYMSSFIFF